MQHCTVLAGSCVSSCKLSPINMRKFLFNSRSNSGKMFMSRNFSESARVST